jgi:hypothetical protein
MKMAEALHTQGIVMPPEVLQWISDCNAVKGKYKKPVSK